MTSFFGVSLNWITRSACDSRVCSYIGKGAKRTIRVQISLRWCVPIRRALLNLAKDAMIGRTVASLGAECDC